MIRYVIADPDGAANQYAESLALRRELGDIRGIASTLGFWATWRETLVILTRLRPNMRRASRSVATWEIPAASQRFWRFSVKPPVAGG